MSPSARALLGAVAVAATALPACRDAPAPPGPTVATSAGDVVFTDATGVMGIEFGIDRSVAGDYFMPDSMGTGCAIFDYDGDGDLDLYLVNGFRPAAGRLETAEGGNRLFRQESDGRFTDATESAGVGDVGFGMGAAVGDIDNDGDADLFVTNYGPDRLYRNDGDGTFTDVTESAGIAGNAWSSSAGFFDYDGDGFLDLYVATYLDYDPARVSRDAAGRREYPSPGAFSGVPDVLYRNAGDGTFRDVSRAAGIDRVPARGLGVVLSDLDADGRADVFVANDGEANTLWTNAGDGTFTNRAHESGLAVNTYGLPEASMGVAHGDYDGDGDVDLFATHLFRETNTLYRQSSPGRFEDVTLASGLGAASLDETGFGAAFLDVDLDGDLDLVVANGRVLRKMPHPGAALDAHWTPYAEPNQVFRSDGSGRFAEVAGGALTRDVEVSRGLAAADVDGDGDVDVVISNGNGTVKVYRNDTARRGDWLLVRAVDPALRRDAIGAVVRVTRGGATWRREIAAGGSYLSSTDPRAHFGLGTGGDVDRITVVWPDGVVEEFPGGPPNRVLELVRGSGRPRRE